ncbi:MAG: MlaD family protein [Phycisphaerae bacterium]|nr:MlaD family protein [Phycisphaerae bacterium]
MSDYEGIQNKKNMIVGAFVIIGVAIFIYMVFLFRELPTAMSRFTSYTVKAKFEYAPGIEADTPVRYCGYHIGRVTNVSPPVMEQNGSSQFTNRVTVTMAISRKYANIPSNVKVELVRKGFSSGHIEFTTEPMTAEELDKLSPKFLQEGMVLKGVSGSSEFLPKDIQDKFNVLSDKLSVLLDNMNMIVGDKENQQNFKNALAGISKAADESAATLKEIRQFSAAGKETMITANEKILQSSEQLGETLIEIQRLLYKINNGDGTVGKLINDDKLYENLVDSSEELKSAIEKMNKTFEKTSKKGIKVSVF